MSLTINEARLLRWQENNRELRRPNNMITEERNELINIYDMLRYLFNVMDKHRLNASKYLPTSLLEKLLTEKYLKKQILTEELSGKGTIKQPYKIKTKYGDAEFFNAKYIFNGKYPNKIEKFQCFGNTMMIAYLLYNANKHAKIVTGIAYLNHPFLHSVILLEDVGGKPMVMDINYDLVIDADFYFKMFQFEKICTIDCKQLGEDWEMLKQGSKYLNFDESCYYLDIAYDDVIRLVKEGLEKEGKLNNNTSELKIKSARIKMCLYSDYIMWIINY